MWTRTYHKTFQNVKKETLWNLWTDVNHWPDWHGDLDYCKLDGTFEIGNYFILKPKGVRPVKIILTEIEKGKKFTDCTLFFGAKMYHTLEIEEIMEDDIKLTSTLVVKGPLKWLWIKLVAQNVANTVPEEMETIVNLARKKHT
ncbi:MAG: hypothetical protein B7Y25_03440 [Alphaproteobacteria bacterium 16-39-46]|nr:MAG: hypothetical protein B7Y25_03440 [Alphaproteobacteria bacterium 16-39-46]OZA43327.1 MAG: hypothetical protein B7X84_03520 [Alphaproteobacteria bacterium 17-39-52]HQS83931.1 polyketide cyclase [Alphaproteobacteria bacterium]HQS93783.1 polyketide cyclase [Alphaproteobacteria bacterium]